MPSGSYNAILFMKCHCVLKTEDQMLKSVLFTQCHQGLNLLSLLSISQYIQCTCWHGASLEAQRSDTPGHTNTIYGDKIVQSGCVLV